MTKGIEAVAITCPACEGRGWLDDDFTGLCDKCHGVGYFIAEPHHNDRKAFWLGLITLLAAGAGLCLIVLKAIELARGSM